MKEAISKTKEQVTSPLIQQKSAGVKEVPPLSGISFLDNKNIQRKENKTGMPDQLKSGVESLSGIDMSDVKVHYNSPQPAQLQAHAYAQGNQIHIAPGQEKHLPHEAWHVVQQKQGRVKPTMQMKGKVNVNDDAGLEKEADEMGAKASIIQRKQITTSLTILPTRSVIQRMPIAALNDHEKHTMKQWVLQGKYQEVLNFLISKFPVAQIKQGAANVKNVADFRTVVDPSEIPQHGGFGVTLGGKLNDKATIPDVYISDEHIKNWVEADQFGSLINTIQHELTHAHQSHDDNFIGEFGTSPTRKHIMEFEAFAGEIQNTYRALKAIAFDESKVGLVEWPTQADLILAYNNMNTHYSRMTIPEQERFNRQHTAILGYYPVVNDFLDRYYNPSSLYKKFEMVYNNFSRNAPLTFAHYTSLIKTHVSAYEESSVTYSKLYAKFSELRSQGLQGEALEKYRATRTSLVSEMGVASGQKSKAYERIQDVYGKFYESWSQCKLKAYQIYAAMNTSDQKQFKKYIKLFEILPGRIPSFPEVVNDENVKAVISAYDKAVSSWNKNAQIIVNLAEEIQWIEMPKQVVASLDNIIATPEVATLREVDPFEDSSRKTYEKQLMELADQSEYVSYHIRRIAPDGFGVFTLALLRKNLNASRQGDLTWKMINKLKDEKPVVAERLHAMGEHWYKNMTPLQLFNFYEQLKKL